MTNITITKTITQPEEVVNLFADDLGYQTMVVNPDYVAGQGSPTMQDPDWVQPEDFDLMTEEIPQVPNPDYVAEVGERMIENPQSRADFVSDKFDEMLIDWLTQFAERNAVREATRLAKEQVVARKGELKATIVTGQYGD